MVLHPKKSLNDPVMEGSSVLASQRKDDELTPNKMIFDSAGNAGARPGNTSQGSASLSVVRQSPK